MSDQNVTPAPAEVEPVRMSPQENSILQELLRPGAKVDFSNATPEELWKTLGTCAHGLTILEARMMRIKPIIGQILLMFENKPSLYRDLGYDTFSDFMNRGVYDTLKLHRTAAYEGKAVARDFPKLSPDRYAKIGTKKMNIISKVTTGNSRNAEILLQVAETKTVSQLQTYVEDRGLLARGEAHGATITITTNGAIFAEFKAFFGDGRIHSVVGSKEWDRILQAMMQECFQEWIDKWEAMKLAKLRGQGD